MSNERFHYVIIETHDKNGVVPEETKVIKIEGNVETKIKQISEFIEKLNTYQR